MGMKKVTGAIAKIRQEAHDWEGTVCPSGLTRFFSEGFLAPEVSDAPGGLMSIPLDRSDVRQTAQDREMELNERFGSGKLSEAAIKDLARAEISLPECMNDALDQLSVTIRLLGFLTGENSIAAEAFRYGRRYMIEHRREMGKVARSDRLFLAKYLHMIDRVFQKFCRRLLKEAEGHKNPIRSAGKLLKGTQTRSIQRQMRCFDDVGAVPPLSLPSIIEEESARTTRSSPAQVARETRGPRKTGSAQATGVTGRGGTQTENKEVIAAWRIPAGKVFADFFGKTHQANKDGFPKIPHHDPKNHNLTKPCLSWHLDGHCGRRGKCFASHIAAAEMSAEARAQIGEKLRAVYKS